MMWSMARRPERPEGQAARREHVAFNDAIVRAGGQLCIFPALQVQAPPHHLYQPSEFHWRWRMTMLARRSAELGRPPWRQLTAPR